MPACRPTAAKLADELKWYQDSYRLCHARGGLKSRDRVILAESVEL